MMNLWNNYFCSDSAMVRPTRHCDTALDKATYDPGRIIMLNAVSRGLTASLEEGKYYKSSLSMQSSSKGSITCRGMLYLIVVFFWCQFRKI
jgi:hypothetical protein